MSSQRKRLQLYPNEWFLEDTHEKPIIGTNDFWGDKKVEKRRGRTDSYFDAQESMCLLAYMFSPTN